MKVQKNLFSSVGNRKLAIVLIMAMISFMYDLQAQPAKTDCDIRLNAAVSASGNLSNDGKGTYYTGKDLGRNLVESITLA